MKNFNFKKLLPHVIAIVLFLVVSVIYCKPALEGKVLNQHDTQGWKGMSQQSYEEKERTGHLPLWANSMFSGMPAYQIAMDANTNVPVVLTYFSKSLSLGLPDPISFFFLASLCFYILCIAAGANPWAAMLGAIAYAYATYDPVIIWAGHITKMLSLAYAPAVLAGILLIFQKKYWLGFAVTAIFASILIGQNHIQIVYYTMIIALMMTLAFFVKSYQEKAFASALKGAAIALVAGLIGLGTCAVSLLPTYEYSKATMRGGASQLTIEKDTSNNKTSGGLDKDYALKWSIGKMETFTFMLPSLYGGSNGGNEHTASAKMVQKLGELGIPEENALGMTNGYSYWGSMSSPSETTSGPVYFGAAICFLFIFGLFYLNSWHKWWVLAASIFGILLAWGSNFQAFNYFMLDYLPFYSKFRAPSMAMVIPQLCIPFLVSLTVSKLIDNMPDMEAAWKKLKFSAIATAAVVVILAGFYFSTDYKGKGDDSIRDGFKQSMLQQVPPSQQPPQQLLVQADETSKTLLKALREDRQSELGSDLLRMVLIIAVCLALVALFVRKKINAMVLSLGLIALTGFDLLNVDKRYLGYDNYMEPEEVSSNFNPSQADLEILKDPDHANFRVFNETSNFTQESLTSYFHNSIGGYHPAKLGLYQDIIMNQIGKGNMQVLDMLNTKYIITGDQNRRAVARLNPDAFGSCWLVKGIKYVSTPNEEMLALDSTHLRDTAVVAKEFASFIKQAPQFDSAAFIKVSTRTNDDITYAFNAATPQFAVFSEVYYKAGWDAYLDGQKADYVKVNYILRGMGLPAGKHTIEFKFEPRSYYLGRTITIWSTILIYLVLVASLVFYFRKKK